MTTVGGLGHALPYLITDFWTATTVAFVWDVLDNTGTRLHRIRGQEVLQGSASDPWSVVGAGVMETIAAKTINDYLAWRATARA